MPEPLRKSRIYGLLRQYLLKDHRPRGAHTQDDLNAIAAKRNDRQRKMHGFRAPWQPYNERLEQVQGNAAINNLTPLARRHN